MYETVYEAVYYRAGGLLSKTDIGGVYLQSASMQHDCFLCYGSGCVWGNRHGKDHIWTVG